MGLIRGSRRCTTAVPGDRSRLPESGQSMVEFSLVLMPLFLILLGIIQFGFVFNSYITISNASREGARIGSIYIYDATKSKAENDVLRNDAIKASVIASMNLLIKTAPNFSTPSWSQSGLTFTNGDLIVTYLVPAGITDADTRVGQQVTVRAIYHQDLVIPLISSLLPKDSGGRLGMTSEVTMVVN
jgi:hypothetical protein